MEFENKTFFKNIFYAMKKITDRSILQPVVKNYPQKGFQTTTNEFFETAIAKITSLMNKELNFPSFFLSTSD